MINFKCVFFKKRKLNCFFKKTPLPGKNMMGRGIILKPHQHFELKSVIFKASECENQEVFTSGNTKQTYCVSKNYEVNESASMQGNQAIEQTVIEDSWELIEQLFSVNTQIAASHHAFRMDMNVGITKPSSLFEDEHFYYVLKSYSVPFWTLDFSNTTELSPAFDGSHLYASLPTQFDDNQRRDYEKFFAQYGTHYVKKVWVGEKITFVLTIAKSLSKPEIRDAVHTMFGGFENEVLEKAEQEKAQKAFDTLQNYLEQTQVVGQGGNKPILSDIVGQGGNKSILSDVLGLCADEKNRYQKWRKTVTQNPAVIEFEAVGVWTLISDNEKAEALREAYKLIFAPSPKFTPISAIVKKEKNLYFLIGNKYICYNTQSGEIEKCGEIEKSSSPEALASIENCFEKAEAVLNLDDAVVFFHQNECFRYNLTQNKIESSDLITDKWEGLPFDKIDAALKMGESVYFFRNDEYSRYNRLIKKVEGSPKKIREEWCGLTFDKIDAAFMVEACEKAYFVRGDEYIRYDVKNRCADPYYPKKITDKVIDDEALGFAQLKCLLSDIESEIKTVKGKKIIRHSMYAAIGVGVVPPLFDIVVLTGIQLKMLHSLANIYGIEFKREFVKSLIGSLVGGSSTLLFSIHLARFIKFIPVIGSVSGIISQSILGSASTYAVGKVFIQHFDSGGTFLTFDPQKVSKYYAQQMEKGREILKTNCAENKP